MKIERTEETADLQAPAVLKHLINNPETGITALEALELYGVFRLAHIIFVLRKGGHKIKTELIQHPKKERCKYARYTLELPKPTI